MGTPALAAHILERLVTASGANFRVVGVVTRPDQPRGRGLGTEPSAVGALAERRGIPTLKPIKIRTPEFLSELKAFAPDLLVVAAYGRILPNSILDVPRIAPMNVHASLLPRHRGASPVEAAILAGDAETGVTIMRIVERMDAGPMYLQRRISIESSDTQGTLKEKLAELGADAMLEAIDLAARGALHGAGRKEGCGDRLDGKRRADRADDARVRSVAGGADASGRRRRSHLACRDRRPRFKRACSRHDREREAESRGPVRSRTTQAARGASCRAKENSRG